MLLLPLRLLLPYRISQFSFVKYESKQNCRLDLARHTKSSDETKTKIEISIELHLMQLNGWLSQTIK